MISFFFLSTFCLEKKERKKQPFAMVDAYFSFTRDDAFAFIGDAGDVAEGFLWESSTCTDTLPALVAHVAGCAKAESRLSVLTSSSVAFQNFLNAAFVCGVVSKTAVEPVVAPVTSPASSLSSFLHFDQAVVGKFVLACFVTVRRP
jgi:hypothetical protein